MSDQTAEVRTTGGCLGCAVFIFICWLIFSGAAWSLVHWITTK